MKRILIALLTLLFLLCGCSASAETALTPENILEKAFAKDKSSFTEAFGIDLEKDAEPDPNTNGDGWYLPNVAELFGRTADRLYLSFPNDKLLSFTYAFSFEAFDPAFDFAQKAAKNAEKKYGSSILEKEYGQPEGVPHLATRDRTDLRLKWEKTNEPVQSTTDAFAVSDDCVLEITLTAFTGEDGTRYLVTLTYKTSL